ncbi:MAG: DUF5004 domain-containing protein [Cyclobacteriaceae bacterium]|jgi:hypothetical protein|nr:DUF5004 domain-containing protein [Cyclobacteriaceae bacterium]
MKLLNKLTSIATLILVVVLLSNCDDGGDSKPPEQVQLEKLSKTWNVVSATLDNNNRTGDFNNFKLTFSGTFNPNSPNGPYAFSVSGSRPTPSPWAASGSWSFSALGTGDSGTLLRDDGVAMTYSIASNGTLTLNFTCASCNYPGGRVDAVNGSWVFTFN